MIDVESCAVVVDDNLRSLNALLSVRFRILTRKKVYDYPFSPLTDLEPTFQNRPIGISLSIMEWRLEQGSGILESSRETTLYLSLVILIVTYEELNQSSFHQYGAGSGRNPMMASHIGPDMKGETPHGSTISLTIFWNNYCSIPSTSTIIDDTPYI